MSKHLRPSDRKNYVLDTSVLVHHGEAVHSFPDDNVYIPLVVLEELDNLKTRMDAVGASCRYVNRFLDEARQLGSLVDGVELDNGQMLFVAPYASLKGIEGLQETNDNKIIAVAANLMKAGLEPTVVSRDIALRVKCDSLYIPAVNYEKDSRDNTDFFFDGVLTIETTKEQIDKFYEHGILNVEGYDLYPNQGVLLKAGSTSAIAMADNPTTVRKLNYANSKGFSVEGIKPRTIEQVFALEMLLDPDIHMISLTGMAGCGKTLLSVAAAISLLHKKEYKKLIISRPVQSTSKDIGFLPGTKEEKMAPWLQPIFDNLEFIFDKKGSSYINLMFERGIIEVEALTYVRGRTLPNTIFIIDEAQNITHHEAKALLTRMGENSKIILIGDLEQIDSPSVDQRTSGLSSVVSLFKEFEHSGHVRLRKGERSKLATFAAKVM